MDKPEQKKVNFGITLNPEVYQVLEKIADEEGISKSGLIEKALKEKIKKKENE